MQSVLAQSLAIVVPPPSDGLPDGAHDFDFLYGRWQIRNERLKERLVGCREWIGFDAVGECRPTLGGFGNVDSFDTDWDGGLRGMTLRLFDRVAQRWSIYWASDRDGVLEPPVAGRFENGIGIFFGPDQHRGTPVLSRFRWTPGDLQARWEQAFSVDKGLTWETNWVMHFTRTGR
jgi:hypothetical protein